MIPEPGSTFDKILARIPATQRGLVKMDDQAAARVVQTYALAREEMNARIDRLWGQTFGANVLPDIDQRVRFATSLEMLNDLDARQAELVGGTVNAIDHAFDAGTIHAIQNSQVERALMAERYPALRVMNPFVAPPGAREEIYINKAVQDASHIAKVTRDQISLQLGTAALAGEGPDAMARRIRPIFDGNGKRAELTSRYVSIKSYNEASKVHYGQMQSVLAPYGRTIYKMWIATENDRTCPICLALHGTIIGIEEDFDLTATFDKRPPPKGWPVGDEMAEPPRHARCRCTIAPWVDGWEHGTTNTPAAMQAEAQRLARHAGYDVPQTPVKGAAPGRPSGPRIHASQIRQIPKEKFSAVKAKYMTCAVGPKAKGPPRV